MLDAYFVLIILIVIPIPSLTIVNVMADGRLVNIIPFVCVYSYLSTFGTNVGQAGAIRRFVAVTRLHEKCLLVVLDLGIQGVAVVD
ncbi:hypothetical protein BDV41DRAFT_539209 [Aspergillus transmontanensis]|uniref:Uncharacterized protein n=1 Tax=Aspergillus transmontanensis TaxID=1034304 RepID=A0A5N6VUW9_9EURO|nr:hypothetical protein BDV41DRAFT_539209 [Aspergillus transmontanensis]